MVFIRSFHLFLLLFELSELWLFGAKEVRWVRAYSSSAFGWVREEELFFLVPHSLWPPIAPVKNLLNANHMWHHFGTTKKYSMWSLPSSNFWYNWRDTHGKDQARQVLSAKGRARLLSRRSEYLVGRESTLDWSGQEKPSWKKWDLTQIPEGTRAVLTGGVNSRLPLE